MEVDITEHPRCTTKKNLMRPPPLRDTDGLVSVVLSLHGTAKGTRISRGSAREDPALAAGSGRRAINKLQSTLCPCVVLYWGHRKWQGGNKLGGTLQPPSCWIPWVGVMESKGAGRSRSWPVERTPPFQAGSGRGWEEAGHSWEVLFCRAGHTGGVRCSRAGPWGPLGSSYHPIHMAWRAFSVALQPGTVPCIAELQCHACSWSVPAQNQGSWEDQR